MMLKQFFFPLLVALVHSHQVLGFVVPSTSGIPTSSTSRSTTTTTTTTTELNLLRKDGKVRSGFRKVRGFVGRRILRRGNPSFVEEPAMREESEAAVMNMVPVLPAFQTVGIEEAEVFTVEDSPQQTQEKAEKIVTEELTSVDNSAAEGPLESVAEPEKKEEISNEDSVESYKISDAEAEALAVVAEAEAALADLEEAEKEAAEELATAKNMEVPELVAELEKVAPEDPVKEKEEEEVVIAEASTETLLIQEVDKLFSEGKPQEAMDKMKEAVPESSGALYWRFVKAHYEMFSATEKQSFLDEGIELVDQAPTEFQDDIETKAFLLKWKAILLGKLGGFQSTKEKMANSFIIKESLEEAQQLLKNEGKEDSSIYQALGEWCFKVAGISFIERQAASMLFGKPPQSTYEEALEFFLKGYGVKSTPTLATKVSETYQKMGKKDLAWQWANNAWANEEVLLP